jgi:putative ABC transport system substrate-binding protein
MYEFFLGVLASLAAAGIVMLFSMQLRLRVRKQFRIWRWAATRALHPTPVGTQLAGGERTLTIAIALNGNAPYIVDMEQAFVAEARRLLEPENILIHVERSLGSAGVTEEGNKQALQGLLSNFINNDPDLIVTFGSGVSSYVHEHHSNIPHIFVGVTDPIASGLCSSFDPDTGRGDICGATFSVTVADRIHLINQAFPFRRIGFIYNPSYAADMHYLNAFRKEIGRVGIPLREISVTKPYITGVDREAVDLLVGWLYLHEHIGEFIKSSKLPVIGGGWVDLRKGACCCISDDEREIGKLAASHILYDYIVNRVPLSQIPIQMPSGNVRQRLMIGLNLDAAARHSISFPKELVGIARYRLRENRK